MRGSAELRVSPAGYSKLVMARVKISSAATVQVATAAKLVTLMSTTLSALHRFCPRDRDSYKQKLQIWVEVLMVNIFMVLLSSGNGQQWKF